MGQKLQTTNVFIDTQYFDSINYNFSGKALTELLRLVTADRARVFLTSVTVGEMNAHLEGSVKEVESALLSFRDKARIVRNIPDLPIHGAFERFDTGYVLRTLADQMDEFIRKYRIEVMDLTGMPAEAVFERYFRKLPPFGTEKKKAEFPDAFVQERLESFCRANATRMYVVSGDHDWRTICDGSETLIWLNKLDEFVALATEAEKTEPANVAKAMWTAHTTAIQDAIEQEFRGSGFYLADEEGDVEGVDVNSLSFEESSLLDVDENSAVFSVTVEALFSVEVSYADFASGSYDHEDKHWAYLPIKTTTVKEDAQFVAEVHLQWDDLNAVKIDIQLDEHDFPVTVQPTNYELK